MGVIPCQVRTGGIPSQVRMGTPLSQVRTRGYPHLRSGGAGTSIPGQVPHPRSGQFVSHPADGGYPHPRSGWVYPLPLAEWVYPSTPIQQDGGTRDLDGGYPQLEQHSVYLLCGGRYASCVHTGGLSCSHCFHVGGSTPESLAVYSGFLNDGVLLLNVSSHNFR